MAYSATPIFYDDVASLISFAVLILSLVVQAVALIHCVTQRGDGFQAIGTLPKGAWAAVLAICLILTLLISQSAIGLFGLIGIAAALIYLLDVRPGLRDTTDGRGSW
jgi:choline-glycine betaine transporter